MTILEPQDLRDGRLASLVSAVAGVMAGAVMIGGDALGALGLIGFTAFGSLFLLLPVFLALRAKTSLSRKACYGAVAVTGAAGGYAMLFLLWAVLGGLSLAGDPSGLFAIGAIFGTATALIWIACHAMLSEWRGRDV